MIINKYNSKPVTSFIFNGDLPKIGYFDPFNITKFLDEEQIKFYREAELQNGRLSLFSLSINNFFDIQKHDDKIILFIYLFYLICFENYRYFKVFDKFQIKKHIQPGCIIYYIPFIKKWSDYELFFIRISMIIYFFKIINNL